MSNINRETITGKSLNFDYHILQVSSKYLDGIYNFMNGYTIDLKV
ncbi:hypothetical protein DSUL_130001 [Desulfovibrionales bacterium]